MRRWAFGLLYTAGRVLEVAGALLHYAAAGTLSLAELRQGMAGRWTAFGNRESEPYRDSGLMPWERDFYLPSVKPGERVLLVGCGTGRDLLALLRAGYRVDGIDIAPDCVETARHAVAARVLSSWLAAGALGDVALPARYDAIIFSWFCYGYIPGSGARIATLHRARQALADGGRVLISYLPVAVSRRYRLVAATRVVARLTGSDWRPERGDAVILGLARGRGVHYEHHFTTAELEGEARAAGLRVAQNAVTDDGHAILIV